MHKKKTLGWTVAQPVLKTLPGFPFPSGLTSRPLHTPLGRHWEVALGYHRVLPQLPLTQRSVLYRSHLGP